MIPQYFVFIAIFTSLFAGSFYIRDIIKGTTRPNLVSWFIWFLAPMIAAFVSLSKGAGISVVPIFMAGFTPLLVILFALKSKNSYWKFTLLDYICLVLSLLAIIVWVFLEEGSLATIFAISADLIAFVPTFVKSWKNPNTETVWPYCSGAFSAVLSVLTLTALSFDTFGFAFYLFLGNLSEILIILFRTRYLNSQIKAQ